MKTKTKNKKRNLKSKLILQKLIGCAVIAGCILCYLSVRGSGEMVDLTGFAFVICLFGLPLVFSKDVILN